MLIIIKTLASCYFFFWISG